MLHGGLSDRTLLHPLILNFLLLLKKNRTSATHDNIWHIVSVQLELGWQNKHIKMLDYTMQRRASSTTKCDKVGTIHSEYQEGTKGNTGTALYECCSSLEREREKSGSGGKEETDDDDPHIRACQSPLPVASVFPIGLRSMEITRGNDISGKQCIGREQRT